MSSSSTSAVSNLNDSVEIVDFEYEKIRNNIIHSVFEQKRNIFLSGPAGTGKSYLILNYIKKIAENLKLNIVLTSTTGVSALALNATTIHRWSGIKLGKEQVMTIVKRIKEFNKPCYKNWVECDILVIDEISMLGKTTFYVLDRVGRKLRNKDVPFGGVQLIMSGDFLQLPPVQDDFVFESDIWDELNIRYFCLKTPKRYPDIDHFNMLQRIRLGKPSSEDIKKLKKRVEAYIQYIGSGRERTDEIKPTRIYSLKKDVEKYNYDELLKLPGELIYYNSIDKFIVKKTKEEKKLSSKEILEYTEFLNSVVPKQVVFKPMAQVMLTYNISLDLGLVNGSRGVVKSCDKDGITILFKNGITTRIVYNKYEFEDGELLLTRFQLPLMLAWATSLHKSQGATLDCAIMDLGATIFCPGMSYVGLSRVRTLEGLLLSSFIPSKLYACDKSLDFEEIMDACESAENNEVTTLTLDIKKLLITQDKGEVKQQEKVENKVLVKTKDEEDDEIFEEDEDEYILQEMMNRHQETKDILNNKLNISK